MFEVSKIMLVPAPGRVAGCRLCRPWGLWAPVAVEGGISLRPFPPWDAIPPSELDRLELPQSQEGKCSLNPCSESEEAPSPAPVSSSLLFPELLGMEKPIPSGHCLPVIAV